MRQRRLLFAEVAPATAAPRRLIGWLVAGAVFAAAVVVAPSAQPSGASSPEFSFGAGGDMGHATPADATLAQMAGSGLSFALHLGDFSYDRFSPETVWCDYIKGGVGSALPYELVAGGHDVGATKGEGTIDNYAACLPDRMGSTGIYGSTSSTTRRAAPWPG
jgi:hypothetical protein